MSWKFGNCGWWVKRAKSITAPALASAGDQSRAAELWPSLSIENGGKFCNVELNWVGLVSALVWTGRVSPTDLLVSSRNGPRLHLVTLLSSSSHGALLTELSEQE